jgi:hypothetical protein
MGVEMPWFPDFVNAAELARKQTRAAGQADPVGQYIAALNEGDTGLLEEAWPDEVVVYDPRAGEVRGHRELRNFVHRSQSLLTERQFRAEAVASTVSAGRSVVEIMGHVTGDGQEQRSWPVAIVAESADDRSIVFRTYLSLWALDGHRHPRQPILPAGPIAPAGDVVSRYEDALRAGDTEAIVSTFAPDGYVQEPVGPPHAHRGTEQLRSFFGRCFSAGGGIGLEPCRVTDDGVRCAVEYNCVRWGRHDLPAQPGIVVFERSGYGLLAAVRIYDDVEAPIALS